MLSHLPDRARVGFQGVDWEVETEKSQRRLERRKNTRQCRGQRAKQRKMSDSQLLSFLQFLIDEENDQNALCMDACDDLVRRVKTREFLVFEDGLPNKKKVEYILKQFDSLKTNGELRALILSWMHAAIAEEIYRHPDEASSRTPDSPSGRSLVYSISTKGSQQSDEETSQASQIPTIDLDMKKVEEFGQVIAFLETEEIEKQLKVLNIHWETLPGSWETAQLVVNEIIKKIQALALNSEFNIRRSKALASFEEVTDHQTRVHFLRLAFHNNTIASVLAESIADGSGSTDASSDVAWQH
jgi:hypothetical protein